MGSDQPRPSVARKSAIGLLLCLLVAGCGASDPVARHAAEVVEVEAAKPPVDFYRRLNNVYKACDEGRAVYVYSAGYSGGIAIVENAAECAAPEPSPDAQTKTPASGEGSGG